MTIEEVKAKYPYLYETHMHTNQGSLCGNNTGAEMADCYKAYGYTGIIITDHNWGGNTCVDRSLPWEEWVDKFFMGYDSAKKRGDEIGLQVFPGWEAGYGGPEFLIYGVSPSELKKHPELWNASIPEQYRIVHSLGGMVIQAHPFRKAWYIDYAKVFYEYADGVEMLNSGHTHPADGGTDRYICDERATELVKRLGLRATAGSDQHSTVSLGGGVKFPTKLASLEDYMDRIMGRADYVLTNGRQYFSNKGELLAE